ATYNTMESLIKEAREIYDGNDFRELNDIYVKNKVIVEKLENLVPRAHKEIIKGHEDHTGPQL
ncbi:8669_t:CDS:2, partial [Racocetra persica]